MKPTKKAAILFSIFLLLVIFWVIPGINHGKETRYVRYYENTDEPRVNQVASFSKPDLNRPDTTQRKTRKFRKEIIEPRKTKRVHAKMFSRAMQFEPILAEKDSLMELVEKDSLVVMQ